MSVIPYIPVYVPNQFVGNNDTLLVIWGPTTAQYNGLTAAQLAALAAATPLTYTTLDSGSPIQLPAWADCSIQFVGTFGAGGNVVIEGSNDGINYGTLNDPYGVSLNMTNNTPRQITERCQFLRPRVTGGDGTTSLTVLGLFRRQPLS